MRELHGLLRRQLRKHLGGEAIPPALEGFLRAVDGAYREFDADRALLERSLDLSSKELIERNQALFTEMSEGRRRLAALESSLEGVAILGPDRRFLYLNPAHARMHGYETAADLVGRPWQVLYDEAEAARLGAEIESMVAAAGAGRWRGEALGRRRDGTCFPQELSLARTAEGGLVWTVRDVSEQKALRDRLLQASKMEAIGRLAGGIAHDFNNLLTGILGNAQVGAGMVPTEAEVGECLAEIVRASRRAASLVRQLLVFSRRGVFEARNVDLGALVREMEKLLRRVIGEDVVFTVTTPKEHACILADAAQVEQVVMNLAVNARDAVRPGGRIAIEVAEVDLDAGYLRAIPDARGGPHVALIVSDDGCGMDAETRARVFDPFFTTKEPGKGTGLGLAIVHGIVSQSGGHVTVESEPGRGTTFRVYFPRAGAPAPRAAPVETAPSPHGEGRGTVLVVEDEETVRALAARILGRAGYTVLCAGGGEEALRIAREHRGRIELVLSDVVMPGMSGPATAQAVRSLHPEAAVLLMSGYSGDRIDRRDLLGPGVDLLPKPFAPAECLERVKRAIERAPSGSAARAS
jgi:PAS domain S-box-containing protein